MTTGDPLLDFALGLRSPVLGALMLGISKANSETVYLGVLPAVYWILSRRIGFILLMADGFATEAAVGLKDAFALPRPPNEAAAPWLDDPSTVFAFPSGHVTAASATWCSVAALLRSRRAAVFGAAAVFAVALSRLYLGVHYTRDVVGGAAIGLAVGLILLTGLPTLEAALGRLTLSKRLLLLAVFPALAALDHSPESLMILSAAGGAAGGEIASRHLRWELPTGDPRTLPAWGLLRLAVGVPVLGVLAFGLGSPLTAGAGAIVLRFAALGVFTTLAGPRLFALLEARFIGGHAPSRAPT